MKCQWIGLSGALFLGGACLAFEQKHFHHFLFCMALSQFLLFAYIEKTKKIKVRKALHYLLAFICCAAPFFITPDDDVNRYFWEGHVFNHGHNPYTTAPAEIEKPAFAEALPNHPEWTAIYGPLFIYLMALISSLGLGVTFLKLSFLLLHFINTFLIKKICPGSHVYRYYLWSPFILLETVGLGHIEQLLVFGTLLLILGSKNSLKWCTTTGLLLGCWIKWWLIPFLPFLFKRTLLKSLTLFFIISLLILFPFRESLDSLTSSLFQFSTLNSHGYGNALLNILFQHYTFSLITLILSLRAVYLFFLGGTLVHQLWGIVRWALVLSPTLHPWYMVLPLTLCLLERKTTTFFFLSLFCVALHDGEFRLHTEGQWITNPLYGLPFFIMLFIPEHIFNRYLLLRKGHQVLRFSIVTPVFNEEKNIVELADNLHAHREHIGDWIVVDGGSKDNSLELARRVADKAFTATKKGRGYQIREGIEHTREDWVVILHSDTRISASFFRELKSCIAVQPRLVGGAFKMAYRDHQHLGPLLFLNAFKTRFLGVSFGDQSQFFHKPALKTSGGFPDMPLMEDVEFSLMIKNKHTAFIQSATSYTSPRRWKEKGRWKNSFQIIKLLLIFLWCRQVFEKVDVEKLYRKYYS